MELYAIVAHHLYSTIIPARSQEKANHTLKVQLALQNLTEINTLLHRRINNFQYCNMIPQLFQCKFAIASHVEQLKIILKYL